MKSEKYSLRQNERLCKLEGNSSNRRKRGEGIFLAKRVIICLSRCCSRNRLYFHRCSDRVLGRESVGKRRESREKGKKEKVPGRWQKAMMATLRFTDRLMTMEMKMTMRCSPADQCCPWFSPIGNGPCVPLSSLCSHSGLPQWALL